jgi:FKBP-type peptidyl-prolyl cis-trans isomerase FkpA
MRRPVASLVLLACGAAAVAQDRPPVPQPAPPEKAAPTEPELRIEVVAKGEGREVKSGDVALVHVLLQLAEGGKTLLDTRAEGDAQPLPVGKGYVIAGLDRALVKMRQGDRWKVAVPYQFAWGRTGYPGAVPPRADVLMDVEVVGFVDLKIEVVASGAGPTPAVGETILVHHVDSLVADGRVVADSRKDDDPLLLELSMGRRVMEGWELALRKMRVGDRWKVSIPWQLAWGKEGDPPRVPARADVLSDLERLPMPTVKTEVIASGKGAACTPGRTVTVHSIGTLSDGTKFDDTRAQERPFSFVLGAKDVVLGWELAVVKMRVGDRWKITVPWVLAYGAQGRPPLIPKRADLTFDVEILDVK